jgi:ABC-type transport system involved in multi-copper enzyme maturation permease subunit
VTGERERETLELLLTTTLASGQILWPKLLSGLRVSSVLTMFLLWPVALAVVMVNTYWTNLTSVLGYLIVVATVCVTTATMALCCSVMFRKTSVSLMATYLSLAVLFMFPLAAMYFTGTFFPDSPAARWTERASFTSPFAAVFSLPIDLMMPRTEPPRPHWGFVAGFVAFYAVFDTTLLALTSWWFRRRWRSE